MADFSKDNDFNKDLNFNRVVFSSGTPILEAELNES
jgi:hypothetical protein